MSRIAVLVQHARQQVLLEGRWLGAAVLVVKGCIRAVRRTDNARELTLETFRSGDLIADAVLLPDGSMPGDGLVAAETSFCSSFRVMNF
jgi:CRP-like cAMP-binding protein